MVVKCNRCKKEDFYTAIYSIGEKFKKRTRYYGRFIYSCSKCYEQALEEFKKSMHKNGELIIRVPSPELPI